MEKQPQPESSSRGSLPLIVVAAHWLVKVVGQKMLENLHGYDFFTQNSPFGF